MTAGTAAEDAVLELQRHDIHAIDIQEISGATVRVDVLFNQFETHPGWVRIAGFDVVYRQGDARCAGVLDGNRLTQVRRKRGNTALARQVVADKCNAIAV